MKKFLALAALVLGLASCQTEPEGLDVNVGGSMNTVVTVTIPEAETRAYSDSSVSSLKNDVLAGDATLRYILQIYDEAGTASEERLVKYSDDKSVNFDVRLIPGRDYQFVVWVDIVDGEADVDKHYVTKDANGKSTLNNITLIESTWKAMDESRDAFTTTELIKDFNSQSGITLTAKRPFAKLRVVSTDTEALNNLHITPTTAVVRYSTKHRTSFNAYKGTFGDATLLDKAHEYTIVSYGEDVENGANRTLFTDYFFADNDIVKFYFTVNDQNGNPIIEEKTFNTDIYVKRNHLTTIMGNILTDNSNFTIIVDDEFDGETDYNVNDIKSASELQKAINDARDGVNTVITLGADINDGTFPIIVPEDKVITLKFNGKNITTPEESTDRHYYAFDIYGALTLEGEGEVKARGNNNYGKLTLNGATIDACDHNGGYAVKCDNGAEFTMNSGIVKTSNENGDAPTAGYDATPIRVEAGAKATINGGTITNVSNYTYALDNHGDTTINGGEMTSIHSTVSTNGTMTINGGSFTCNGLDGITAHALIAWDGSETTINGGTFDGKDNYNGFNVNSADGAVVNIYGGQFLNAHSGSLYGNGTINVMGGFYFDDPTARVATGYHTIKINDTLYTVMKYRDDAYIIEDAFDLTAFSTIVDKGATFEGTVVKVINDITLPEENWNPIGDNRTDAAFSGTFDGQNHTISGAKISGDFCWDGSVYGSKEGWGLFSVLDGATVKNVKLDNEVFASYTVISGAVAGYAHDTTFENIDITNTKIAGYNWYTGGVVGWASGNCTFKDINLDSSVAVGTLWDSHGQNAGGIAGGVSGEGTYTIEDCNIACVMDVINDVTSNYKWYIYRVSGMIIGNTNTTEAQYNTVVTATATNVTCKNVTVTYGDWMNYHYCEGYWNRGWGRVESSDYVGGIDHTQCNHPDGESHYVCIPFDQLFGGSSNGSGHYPVRGLAEFEGVTVNYPASYVREVSSSEELKKAFEAGANVVLSADVTLEEKLEVAEGKNVNLDLNGKKITVTDAAVDPVFTIQKESTLTITGNGTVEIKEQPFVSLIFPRGDVVIENGTFIKTIPAGTPANKVGPLFVGVSGGTKTVTINGGYFDGGYYNADAADIDEILAGTKTFDETADDIAKRGNSNDANKVRVAVKENVQNTLNKSGNNFWIYGGTFVGVNPAWGDEGCMLPTTPNYLRPWSYYQGALLAGQTFNENGLVIPDGYTITKGANADGVPTYTVEYNK